MYDYYTVLFSEAVLNLGGSFIGGFTTVCTVINFTYYIQQSTKHDKEKIYITPAKEESALYAQIVNIRIPELERNAIE